MKNGKRSHSLDIVRHFFPKVDTVEDANKPIIVEVTDRDVKIAKIKRHKTCALAVACHRTFKADGIIIGLTAAYVVKGNLAVRYRLGHSISREITSFDRGSSYDIGFYQLTPASPAARLGKVRSINPNRSGKHNPGSIPKRFRHYTRGVRTSLSRLPEEGLV